jgi:hypothetical protein
LRLSWGDILKNENYRAAFSAFDAKKIAATINENAILMRDKSSQPSQDRGSRTECQGIPRSPERIQHSIVTSWQFVGGKPRVNTGRLDSSYPRALPNPTR